MESSKNSFDGSKIFGKLPSFNKKNSLIHVK
jgi:hypothetical protein